MHTVAAHCKSFFGTEVSVQRMVPDGRRGPGRPAIGGRVSVNLGDDLLAELDRIAQVQGMERLRADPPAP